MASMVPPKKNTAYVFEVGLTSQADTKLLQVNPTLATGDVKVQTDDGSLANITTLPTGAASSKRVKVSLSADEMNGDNIWVQFSDAAGAEWCDLGVCIQTAAQQVDDLATSANQTTILARLGTWTGTGINNVLGAMRALFRKDGDVAVPSDINTNLGGGAGAANSGTDSLEAIRDRGDAAWVTGGDATAANQATIIGGLATILAAIPSAATVATAVWAAGARTLTSFGTLVADLWAYVTRTLTSGAAPSAASIADAVWDEGAADHNAAGSTGQRLNASGTSADPLLNQVPGAYASGTAGAALGKIGVGRITTVSPVAQGGEIELVRGDDYLEEDGRALEWIDENAAWPDLTEAVISLGISGSEFAGEVITGTGANKKVRAEPDAAYTSALAKGIRWYQVQAILATGSVVTLVHGRAIIREDLAPSVPAEE